MMLLLMEKDDGNIEIRNHNLDHIFEGIFSKDG